MNTNQEQIHTSPLQGNLVRLGERHEIAIYLRDGMAWVADFKAGRGEVFAASAWFSLNRGGSALRRMAHDSIMPLPEDVAERIEYLHRRMAKPSVRPAMPRELAMLIAGLRNRLARFCGPLFERLRIGLALK